MNYKTYVERTNMLKRFSQIMLGGLALTVIFVVGHIIYSVFSLASATNRQNEIYRISCEVHDGFVAVVDGKHSCFKKEKIMDDLKYDIP